MLLSLALTNHFVAKFIGASDGQFEHETPNWNVWLKYVTNDLTCAKRTRLCLFDTLFAEQVVAARSFDSIDVDLETDRAYPAII